MLSVCLPSAKLAVDETPVPVLDPGRGKTKTGYFWAIARDDRPWGGTDPPAVAYTYAPGRGGEHLEKLLANYRGIVQCDGYAPYKKLPAARITVAFCWSHLRREFFKIAERGDAPIATEAVARIAQIYVIEKDVRGTSADERRVARQARSRPLVDALRIFFEHQLDLAPGDAAILVHPLGRPLHRSNAALASGAGRARSRRNDSNPERAVLRQGGRESLCGDGDGGDGAFVRAGEPRTGIGIAPSQ